VALIGRSGDARVKVVGQLNGEPPAQVALNRELACCERVTNSWLADSRRGGSPSGRKVAGSGSSGFRNNRLREVQCLELLLVGQKSSAVAVAGLSVAAQGFERWDIDRATPGDGDSRQLPGLPPRCKDWFRRRLDGRGGNRRSIAQEVESHNG